MHLELIFALSGILFCGGATEIRPINLPLCQETRENVSKFFTDVYVVKPQQYDSCYLTNTSTPVMFRVTTSALETNLSNPVVFVARSERYVQTWRIPLELPQVPQLFHTVERILCSVPPSPLSWWKEEEEEVIIDVFTSSTEEERYTVEVTPVEDTVLKLDTEVQLEVSANSPEVRYFEFPPSVSSVVIRATMEKLNISEHGCIIVSVKNATCPVDVIHQNALSSGVYQTMSSQATILVTAQERELIGQSFFLVLMVTSPKFCNPKIQETSGHYNDIHTVNVTISELKGADDSIFAIVLPAILLVIGAAISILYIVFQDALYLKIELGDSSWQKCICEGFNFMECLIKFLKCLMCCDNWGDTIESCCKCTYQGVQSQSAHTYTNHSTNRATDSETTPLKNGIDQQKPESDENGKDTDTPSNFTLKLGDEASTHTCTLESGGKCTDVMLSSIMKNEKGAELNIKYRMYFWVAVIIGFFYGLPSLQFVVGQQLSFHEVGNEDICYYNFECIHPAHVFVAFNNIWSNIGYVILGVAFIFIVLIRSHIHSKRNEDGEGVGQRWSTGVPQFYGLYYAMGFALIMEGLMSSLYHVCPSELNFQFDTAFMFVIGGLLTVKVLQSRHPYINGAAYIAFLCFAVVICLTLIGIYFSRLNATITRFMLYFLLAIAVLIFSASFYNHHQIFSASFYNRHQIKNLCTTKLCCEKVYFCQNKRQCCWCFKHPVRLTRFVVTILANGLVGIVTLIKGEDVATIVLYLFITTALSVLVCYLIFKVFVYREPSTLANYIFFILMVSFFVAALYFFTGDRVASNWTLSPSESRALNQPCRVLSFYDNHDVWHFLSACALFFSFMFMLTLDDGVRNKPTEELPVF